MDELRSIHEKSIGQDKVEFNFKTLLIIIINSPTMNPLCLVYFCPPTMTYRIILIFRLKGDPIVIHFTITY